MVNDEYGRLKERPKSDKLTDILRYDAELVRKRLYDSTEYYVNTLGNTLESMNLKKPLKIAYDYTTDSIERSTDINIAVISASAVSGAINYLVTNYAVKKGFDEESIKDISFKTEVIFYTMVSVPIFMYEKRKEGLTWGQSFEQLIRFGMTGASVSFLPYRLLRGNVSGELADHYGLSWPIAAPASQFVLLPFYAFAIDMFGKPMNYLIDNRRNIGKRIKDITINGSQKVMKGRRKDKE